MACPSFGAPAGAAIQSAPEKPPGSQGREWNFFCFEPFGFRPDIEPQTDHSEKAPMHGLIYIIGLIVVILFVLSFLGLR